MSGLETYKASLRQHDWWFAYSDDPVVHRMGHGSYSSLTTLRAFLDPDYTIWNSIAPMQFHGSPRNVKP